jgi:hypothetical protein
MSRRTNSHFEAYDDDDDDEEFGRLSSKVKLLKTVSIQIGEETREHNKFLRQLDSSADTVWGMLSSNMEGVKKLARSGSNRLVFYLLAFAFFVIIVIYLINKRL